MAFAAYNSTTPGSRLQSRIRVLARFILIGLWSPVLVLRTIAKYIKQRRLPALARKGSMTMKRFRQPNVIATW
ncbi:hypothetical protein V8C34DRAFT_271228 [Trichoderma compactum]